MSFIIGVVLAGVVLLAIARPLLHPPVRPQHPAEPPASDQDEALRMLAELEYDYRMDKIDEAEYRHQRGILERRAGE